MAEKNKILFLAVIAITGLVFTACPEPETDKPAITTITIKTQPTATTNVTAGNISGSLSITAGVNPSATLRYQWYSNTSAVNTGGIIQNGATNSSFTIPTTLEAGTYYYFCEVSAAGETAVRSTVATVIVVTAPIIASGPVIKILFSGPTQTVTLNNLSNNDIYLVKINISGLIVSAANTGGISGSSPGLSPNIQSDEPRNELPRMGHPAADEFNANPPPITDAEPRRARAVFIPPVDGDTRMFWVESYYHNNKWVQKRATLRAAGQYSNIWVMDENYGSGGGNKITIAQAQTLAAKFDLIYPAETNLLGYEYGGGPGGDGGRDGDPKIQILVYDIVNASGVAQAAGFFWSKDFYPQIVNDLLGYKSNLAEIFYIDASQVNSSSDYIYSTLIHEFQHMINFNVKTVKQLRNSETWYSEMLSMQAEDLIGPLIGVPPTNSKHPIKQKIPTFLNNYHVVGITEWHELDSNSYAKGYAFGAYLLRNYGGARLLQEILANNSTNIASVTAALRTVNEHSGLSFEEALRRYGEAMIYSGTNMPADVLSFDKTVEKTIGDYTYTATKFNIWSDFSGLKIFGVNEQLEMRPYSLTVHQASSGWKNQSGTKTITLQSPNDPNVEFYLMVK